MLASDLVIRAREVADLPNSKFVTHNMELNSLNESWKDIYAALVENDDDYYVTEVTLTLTPAMAVAGANNEYLCPLPSDFHKLRYLDYQGNGADWWPVKKFPISMKDAQPGEPYYRIKGAFLWIVGGSNASSALSFRMGYYPSTPTVTAPMAPLSYGTSYLPNLFGNVTAPGYAPFQEIMVYAYTSTIITAESVRLGTVSAPVALFTEAGAVTNIVYYKGVLYWIRGGFIWYKNTALTAAFVAPTQATNPAGVTSFFILNNVIYYTNATQVRSCNLTGAADALVYTVVATSVAAVNISTVTVFYVTAGILYANAFGAILTGISEVQSDGTNLYVRDTSYQLRKIEISITLTACTVVSDTVIATDVVDIGQPQWDVYQSPKIYMIPVLKDMAQTLQALDSSVDYDFTYPNNVVTEIMAYQSAVDYRSKQKQDAADIKERLGALWTRFTATIRRDEYKPERIRNVYSSWGFR